MAILIREDLAKMMEEEASRPIDISSTPLTQRAFRPRFGGSPWLLLFPGALGLSVFVIIPSLAIVALSLSHWNLYSSHVRWSGLSNYLNLVHSQAFWSSLEHTLVYSLVVGGVLLPFALGLAWILNQSFLGKELYRMIIFLPYVIPLAATGVIFSGLLAPSGIADALLGFMHITPPNWLGSVRWALVAIIGVSIWEYLGFYMLLFLSALQQLNPSLSEAAAMDGAGWWSRFWRIVIPQIMPTILFASVMIVVQTFQAFDQIYVMTSGGPAGATTTLIYYIYEQGFQFFNIGQASAASVVMMVLVGLIVALEWYASAKWGGDPS